MRTDFASSDLTGKTIGNWKVGDLIVNNDTTAQYSLFYHVEDENGSAIMKVLDTSYLAVKLQRFITRPRLPKLVPDVT